MTPNSMQPVLKPQQMSKNGAISANDAREIGAENRRDWRRAAIGVNRPAVPSWRRFAFDSAPHDDFFLPNFCAPRMVLTIVLVLELLALTLALARPSS